MDTTDPPALVKSALSQVPHSPASVLDAVITDAHTQDASDVHLECRLSEFQVRLRIRGDLLKPYLLPISLFEPCVARIKAIAGLRSDGYAAAQDGSYETSGGLRLRVSIVPSHGGEKVALRLLDGHIPISFDAPGLLLDARRPIIDTLARSSGLVLICGATGSGKTSTLYMLAHEAAQQGSRSVISVEDPVERVLDFMTQLPVGPGFSFPHALRAVLRQDPDVIVVGEIRDSETATLATHAALTGHLVLATVHARTAVESIVRMRSLGVDSTLLASCLELSIAQRLVTGSGNRAVFEVLTFPESVSREVGAGGSAAELEQAAIQAGAYVSRFPDAL